MHAEAWQWIQARLGTLPPLRHVVEFGSRNVNGTVRDLVAPTVPYTGVDVHQGPGVDVVCPAEQFRPEGLVDLVICAETLEHATNPEALIRNASEMLASGGHLLMTWAGPTRPPHSGWDGGPVRPGEWYCGLPLLTVQAWCVASGLTVAEVHDAPTRGDVYLLAVKP